MGIRGALYRFLWCSPCHYIHDPGHPRLVFKIVLHPHPSRDRNPNSQTIITRSLCHLMLQHGTGLHNTTIFYDNGPHSSPLQNNFASHFWCSGSHGLKGCTYNSAGVNLGSPLFLLAKAREGHQCTPLFLRPYDTKPAQKRTDTLFPSLQLSKVPLPFLPIIALHWFSILPLWLPIFFPILATSKNRCRPFLGNYLCLRHRRSIG